MFNYFLYHNYNTYILNMHTIIDYFIIFFLNKLRNDQNAYNYKKTYSLAICFFKNILFVFNYIVLMPS